MKLFSANTKRNGVFKICLFLFLLIVLNPFIIVPVYNNILLSGFSSQLAHYALPVHTQKVAFTSVCGKLNGSGNGMDFAGVLLVKSELSKSDLHTYYQEAKFKKIKKEGYSCSVDVVPMDSPSVNSEYIEHPEIEFKLLTVLDSLEGYYAIILYDGGYSAAFDIRGH